MIFFLLISMLLYICLALLPWMKHPIQSWIEGWLLKQKNRYLDFVPDLTRKLFSLLLLYTMMLVGFLYVLYIRLIVPSVPALLRSFPPCNYQWMLNFAKCFLCICWYSTWFFCLVCGYGEFFFDWWIFKI